MARLEVTIDGQVYDIQVDLRHLYDREIPVEIEGERVTVLAPDLSDEREEMQWILKDGGRTGELVFSKKLGIQKSCCGGHRVSIRELESPHRGLKTRTTGVQAPIPGQVIEVMVVPGQLVVGGQPLLVLEAMKMANHICSLHPGAIRAVHVRAGQVVEKDQVLVEVE